MQGRVAAKFSAKPELANELAPLASFDCKRAETRLETAICSDKKLAQADIVLGRAYGAVLKSVPSTDGLPWFGRKRSG